MKNLLGHLYNRKPLKIKPLNYKSRCINEKSEEEIVAINRPVNYKFT